MKFRKFYPLVLLLQAISGTWFIINGIKLMDVAQIVIGSLTLVGTFLGLWLYWSQARRLKVKFNLQPFDTPAYLYVFIETENAISITDAGIYSYSRKILFWKSGERRLECGLIADHPSPVEAHKGNRIRFRLHRHSEQIKGSKYICAFIEYNEGKIKRSKMIWIIEKPIAKVIKKLRLFIQ